MTTTSSPPSPSSLDYYLSAPRFPCVPHTPCDDPSAPGDSSLAMRVAAAGLSSIASGQVGAVTDCPLGGSADSFAGISVECAERPAVGQAATERAAAEVLATLERASEVLGAEERAPHPLLTPRDREYRVRETIERRNPHNPAELLLNRFEYSLERARTQMVSQPDTPRFRFQIPDPALGPEIGSFRFPVMMARTEEVVIGAMAVGISSDIGNFRPLMEDTNIAAEFVVSIAGREFPCALFGVFDGHGGFAVSLFVRERIQRVLQQLILAHNQEGLSDVGMYNALKLLGVHLNETFNRENPYGGEIGTTLVASLFINGNLYVVNIGDSRAILDLNGTAIQLSEDQKPADPYYAGIIRERGGFVSVSHSGWGAPPGPARVNGILATARAIGDASCGPEFSLSARSKVTKFPLEQIPEESFLVLVSDGITDVVNTARIVAAIHENRTRLPSHLSRGLVHSAIEAGSTDNVTAIVVRIR